MSQSTSQRYNVEPPYIYSGSDDVYKLTIFMTPAHWKAFSAWSSSLNPSDVGNPAWLHLSHETKKVDEYKKTMQEMTDRLKNGVGVCELHQTQST